MSSVFSVVEQQHQLILKPPSTTKSQSKSQTSHQQPSAAAAAHDHIIIMHHRQKPASATVLCRWLILLSSVFAFSAFFFVYEIFSLSRQLSTADWELDACERKIQRHNEKLKALKEDKTDLKAEFRNLRNKLREEESLHKQLTADLTRKNLALSETVSQINSLRELNQILAQNLSEARDILRTVQEENKVLLAKHKQITDEDRELKEKLKQRLDPQQPQLLQQESQLKVPPPAGLSDNMAPTVISSSSAGAVLLSSGTETKEFDARKKSET